MYSKYNVYLNNYPKAGYTLIYNLFTRKEICIKTSLMKNPPEKLREKLINYGILINKDEYDEIKKINSYYINNLSNKDELRIMLILTRNCNCNCIYCYENQQNVYFNDITNSDSILEFITERLDYYNLTKLKIIFYGGEPLLKKSFITHLSEMLHAKMQENYKFSIISNGTLLNYNDVLRWNSLGLSGIKITIDGSEQSHNQRRPYKNGNGTYRDIINNISKIGNETNLLLNIVIDNEVYGIDKLIDEITEHNINAEYELSVREPDHYSPSDKAQLVIKYSKILVRKKVKQNTKISFDHGIICMGKDRYTFVIDGSGTIFRCNGNFTSKIGTLNMKTINKEPKPLSNKCLECQYLPICYGGCLFENRCQKEYFSAVIPELIKLYTAIVS